MSEDGKTISGMRPEIPVNKVDNLAPGAPGQTVPQHVGQVSYGDEQVATPADFAEPHNVGPVGGVAAQTQEQQAVLAAYKPDAAPVNPLLARIQLPGETFKLPSCGVFYRNGELDSSVRDAEVHVHPMTVLDEIMIKTPDMLFSGQAVEEVFGRCIPQVLKAKDLLAKDVDFLLLCLRKVSYGSGLEMETTHWDCKKTPEGETANSHPYMVDVGRFISATKRLDPTTAVTTFTVKLPNGQTVGMTPIRFRDFVTLMQTREDEELTPEQLVDLLVGALSGVITNVDEITDKGMIIEWLRKIKPEFLSKLNKELDETVSWGADLTYKVQCKDCGETQEVTAPLNPLAFFT